MTFPTSLDTFINPTATDPRNNPSLAGQQSEQNDAIEALEAKVGINSSAVATSLDYLVKSTSSSNPGHKHTLANGATDVTASAAELNIMDGVTSTAAELNILDGVTSTTAELNVLDGITATVTELNLTDGLGDAFTSFTPSWTNITVGSGTSTGAYKQVGKDIKGWALFTYGSGSSVGAVSLALPVAARTGVAGTSMPIGRVTFEDSGTGYIPGLWLAVGEIRAWKTDTVYPLLAALSSSVPFTWATNDKILVNFSYEAA